MTYNFDPDRWYDMEFRALQLSLERGDISRASYQKALEDLQQRYEQITDSLDGTYRIF